MARGDREKLHEVMLVKEHFWGCEKIYIFSLISMLIIFLFLLGMKLRALILVPVFVAGLTFGKVKYKKDPFFFEKSLIGFFSFEIKNRYFLSKNIRTPNSAKVRKIPMVHTIRKGVK